MRAAMTAYLRDELMVVTTACVSAVWKVKQKAYLLEYHSVVDWVVHLVSLMVKLTVSMTVVLTVDLTANLKADYLDSS